MKDLRGIYFRADTSFMSAWDRFWTRYYSRYTIKEFGNGDFRVYQMVNMFGLFPMEDTVISAHPNFDSALDWCEWQFKESRVKAITYVVEYD
jgi:hypothetical protein